MFLEVCNDLLLEELTAAQRPSASSTALIAMGGPASSSRSSAPPLQPQVLRGFPWLQGRLWGWLQRLVQAPPREAWQGHREPQQCLLHRRQRDRQSRSPAPSGVWPSLLNP
jgi:hypothetical protein